MFPRHVATARICPSRSRPADVFQSVYTLPRAFVHRHFTVHRYSCRRCSRTRLVTITGVLTAGATADISRSSLAAPTRSSARDSEIDAVQSIANRGKPPQSLQPDEKTNRQAAREFGARQPCEGGAGLRRPLCDRRPQSQAT